MERQQPGLTAKNVKVQKRRSKIITDVPFTFLPPSPNLSALSICRYFSNAHPSYPLKFIIIIGVVVVHHSEVTLTAPLTGNRGLL